MLAGYSGSGAQRQSATSTQSPSVRGPLLTNVAADDKWSTAASFPSKKYAKTILSAFRVRSRQERQELTSPLVRRFVYGPIPTTNQRCPVTRSRFCTELLTSLQFDLSCFRESKAPLKSWRSLSQVTRILQSIEGGDPKAAEELLPWTTPRGKVIVNEGSHWMGRSRKLNPAL